MRRLNNPGRMALFRQPSAGPQVGQRNGEPAPAPLLQHGVSLVAESLFGKGYRQVFFDVNKGDVWRQQVHPSAAGIEAEQELAWHASR